GRRHEPPAAHLQRLAQRRRAAHPAALHRAHRARRRRGRGHVVHDRRRKLTDFAATLSERPPYRRPMRKLLPLVLSILTARAFADVPPEHSVVLTGDFSASFQHWSSSVASSSSISLLRLAPTFDWVASGGPTVRAALVWEHGSTSSSFGSTPSSSDADDYGVIPRVGYAAPLGTSAFVWPRLGFGYLHGAPDLINIPVSTSSSDINRWQVVVDLP